MSSPAHPPLDHRLRRMTGRDPEESHRASTPLELLFDLTFVVAFSAAGAQTAHLLELGHWMPAIGGFAFAVFAIWWAWINFSWLASAYDNDDVFFRVATMVEMLGVLVLALGLPDLFHSLDEGEHVDNGVVIAGYVVMRVATIALWLRAAKHDPARRRTAMAYVWGVAIVQVGWVALLIVNMTVLPALLCTAVLVALELVIPYVAEHRGEGGTPWHAHHIAERYGLLVIITLGEIILGTILAISAVVEEQDWSVEAGIVAFGGTALAFGLWWVYFTMPSGKVLHRFRERGFVWGYLHYFIFVALAGTGAGLHVAAYEIEGVAHIGLVAALLTIVIPVALFLVALFTIYSLLLRRFDPFHVWLFVGGLLVLVIAVVSVASGASFGVGILITAAAPFVVVVGFETIGHRHQAAALAAALGD